MSDYRLYPNLKINDIFLPSDFSQASEVAFFHALKLALVSKSNLTMLHVDSDGDDDWHSFPGVRETLERWQLIPPNSPKHAVAKLDIDVRKIMLDGSDPVVACTEYLEINNADLIVLAIQQRDGIMRWFASSVGEPIARNAKQMTLFVPEGVKGFVSPQDGSVSLKNILIPVANKPNPQPAIEAVIRLIEGLELQAGTVTLLHAGPESEMPKFHVPEMSNWKWITQAVEGEPTHVILKTADEINADLIVMTTDGPDGFLDGLRGTTSERVLRSAKCPVGNLPLDSLLG